MLVKLTQRCDRCDRSSSSSRSVSVCQQSALCSQSVAVHSASSPTSQSTVPSHQPVMTIELGVGHRQPQKLTVQQSVRRSRGPVSHPVPCLLLSDLVSLARSVCQT